MPDCFHDNLSEVLQKLSQDLELSRPAGLKISGPQCHLDLETFDLLTHSYKNGQYSKGVITAFSSIKDHAGSDHFVRACRAVRLLRRTTGKHSVTTTLFPDEMEELKEVSRTTSLAPAAVLEASAYIYFRAKADRSA